MKWNTCFILWKQSLWRMNALNSRDCELIRLKSRSEWGGMRVTWPWYQWFSTDLALHFHLGIRFVTVVRKCDLTQAKKKTEEPKRKQLKTKKQLKTRKKTNATRKTEKRKNPNYLFPWKASKFEWISEKVIFVINDPITYRNSIHSFGVSGDIQSIDGIFISYAPGWANGTKKKKKLPQLFRKENQQKEMWQPQKNEK